MPFGVRRGARGEGARRPVGKPKRKQRGAHQINVMNFLCLQVGEVA